MRLPSKDELEMYQRWGVEAPSHDAHGTIEEIQEKMEQLRYHSWRLEGNELVGEGDHGIIRQRIDPNYILTGTDKEGLPILKKVL